MLDVCTPKNMRTTLVSPCHSDTPRPSPAVVSEAHQSQACCANLPMSAWPNTTVMWQPTGFQVKSLPRVTTMVRFGVTVRVSSGLEGTLTQLL